MTDQTRLQRYFGLITAEVEKGIIPDQATAFANKVVSQIRAEAKAEDAEEQLSAFLSKLDALVLQLSTEKAQHSGTKSQSDALERIWDVLRKGG